jgi:hypothetical protein
MSVFNRFVKINPMYVLPMKQHINRNPSDKLLYLYYNPHPSGGYPTTQIQTSLGPSSNGMNLCFNYNHQQDPSSGYHDASLPLLDAVDFHLPRLFAISSCS